MEKKKKKKGKKKGKKKPSLPEPDIKTRIEIKFAQILKESEKKVPEEFKLPYEEFEYKKWDYEFVKGGTLGEGSFGSVFAVTEKSSGNEFAVKIFKHDLDDEESFIKEVRFSKYGKAVSVSHLIINVFHYGILVNTPKWVMDKVYEKSPRDRRKDPELRIRHYFIVMEKMSGSLEDLLVFLNGLITPTSEKEGQQYVMSIVYEIFRILIIALFKIVNKGIMLNDIKPANVLYREEKLKDRVVDFYFKFSDYSLSCYSADIDVEFSSKYKTPETDIRNYKCPIGGPTAPPMYTPPETGSLTGYFSDIAFNIWQLGQTLLQMLLLSRHKMYTIDKTGKRTRKYGYIIEFIERNSTIKIFYNMDDVIRDIIPFFIEDESFRSKLEFMLLAIFIMLDEDMTNRVSGFISLRDLLQNDPKRVKLIEDDPIIIKGRKKVKASLELLLLSKK